MLQNSEAEDDKHVLSRSFCGIGIPGWLALAQDLSPGYRHLDRLGLECPLWTSLQGIAHDVTVGFLHSK